MSIAPTDPEILARAESTKVCIAGLHKFFDELHVLRGVDLTVDPGSVTVLIGPSGSGKSTLLRCINELTLEGKIHCRKLPQGCKTV